MLGIDLDKALNKLGDKIAKATIEGLERGAAIIAEAIKDIDERKTNATTTRTPFFCPHCTRIGGGDC